jgi:hypothetical protein
MTIIKNIINSAKKTWRGEEDPVKVFYTWGLACYIILPLFTFGLGYLSIVFLGKFIDILGIVLFTALAPIFMPLLVDPLLTYILYSRNIHNVKAKNIKVKKIIVRGLLFDINFVFSVILFLFLSMFVLMGGVIAIYIAITSLFIFSNAYRYYKYSLKYQLIFNEKLLNYKAPTIFNVLKYTIEKIIYKLLGKNISNQEKCNHELKKINTNKIKLSILELLYLSIFIFLIFLIKNIY